MSTANAPSTATTDRATIEANIAVAMRFFLLPGQVTELRCLGKVTCTGFFDAEHIPEFAREASWGSVQPEFDGVYFVPNPLKSEVLARRPNRASTGSKPGGACATDDDVQSRKRALIDVDPIRAAGHEKDSATDEEKAAAAEVACKVRAFLRNHGWPEPLVVDSGNGWHLYYLLADGLLPLAVCKETDPLVRLLSGLADKFDTAGAKVDRCVYNPSRLMKVPGSIARKGKPTDERPHRASALVEVPSTGRCVTADEFAAVLSLMPEKIQKRVINDKHGQTVRPVSSSTESRSRDCGTTAYGRKALTDECESIAKTTHPGRNNQLNKSAFAIFRLVGGEEIDPNEAESALHAAAIECGLDESEIAKTMNSAKKGLKEPRSAPEQSRSGKRTNGTVRPASVAVDRPDQSALSAELEANLTEELRKKLCEQLKIPQWAGKGIQNIGWWPGGYRPDVGKWEAGWIFPERAGDGTIVGLNCCQRLTDDKRRTPVKGSMGITLPAKWPPKQGRIVFWPEGASNVMTATAAGLAAAGRPSNSAGLEDVIAALARLPAGTESILVGDNDWEVELKRRCPGRLGAYETASRIAQTSGRPFRWSMTPGNSKDIRDCLIDKAGGRTSRNAWKLIGQSLADQLCKGAETVYPNWEDYTPAPVHRCQRSTKLRLEGRQDRPSAGKRATLEVRCRCWQCRQCRSMQRNRWLFHLNRAIGFLCDPMQFSGGTDDPTKWNLDSQAGPWKLGYAVILDSEWEATRLQLTRLSEFDHSEAEYVKITLSDAQTINPYVSSFVCIKDTGTLKKTKNDTSGIIRQSLVFIAVSPRQSLPHRFQRFPAARAIPVIEAALDSVRVPEENEKRFQPIVASEHWTPDPPEETERNWTREGGSRFTPKMVRKALEMIGNRPLESRPVGENVLDSIAWPERKAPLLEWLWHRLQDPSVAKKHYTDERVIDDAHRTFCLWEELILKSPEPIPRTSETEKAIVAVLAEGRDPAPDDLDRLQWATHVSEIIAEMEGCTFPPFPFPLPGDESEAESKPRKPRKRRVKPNEVEYHRVMKETIGK